MPSPEPAAPSLGSGRVWALLALCALGVALALWSLPAPEDLSAQEEPLAAPRGSAAVAASAPAVRAAASGTRIAAPPAALPGPAAKPAIDQDLAAHIPPGEAPPMAEVIQRLNQAGVHSGLGAFNPPGTRPPLIGLAVPEDFELPPGFVRHHQATDDGQRIEAVLMFAPDHPYVLAHPELTHRVVPPAMAPPGLPLRSISLPTPRSPKP